MTENTSSWVQSINNAFHCRGKEEKWFQHDKCQQITSTVMGQQ